MCKGVFVKRINLNHQVTNIVCFFKHFSPAPYKSFWFENTNLNRSGLSSWCFMLFVSSCFLPIVSLVKSNHVSIYYCFFFFLLPRLYISLSKVLNHCLEHWFSILAEYWISWGAWRKKKTLKKPHAWVSLYRFWFSSSWESSPGDCNSWIKLWATVYSHVCFILILLFNFSLCLLVLFKN